jgi:hypothetical protein
MVTGVEPLRPVPVNECDGHRAVDLHVRARDAYGHQPVRSGHGPRELA